MTLLQVSTSFTLPSWSVSIIAMLLLALIGAVWRLGSSTGNLRSELTALRASLDSFKGAMDKFDSRLGAHARDDDERFTATDRRVSRLGERVARLEGREDTGSIPRIPLVADESGPISGGRQ